MPADINLKKTELSYRILHALYQEDLTIEDIFAKETPDVFELAFAGQALLHLDKKNTLGLIGYAFDKSTSLGDTYEMKKIIEETIDFENPKRSALFAYFHLAHHKKDTCFWDKEKTLTVIDSALKNFPDDLKIMLYALEHSFSFRNDHAKSYERDIDRAKIIATYTRVKALGYTLEIKMEETILQFREESKESKTQSWKSYRV